MKSIYASLRLKRAIYIVVIFYFYFNYVKIFPLITSFKSTITSNTSKISLTHYSTLRIFIIYAILRFFRLLLLGSISRIMANTSKISYRHRSTLNSVHILHYLKIFPLFTRYKTKITANTSKISFGHYYTLRIFIIFGILKFFPLITSYINSNRAIRAKCRSDVVLH